MSTLKWKSAPVKSSIWQGEKAAGFLALCSFCDSHPGSLLLRKKWKIIIILRQKHCAWTQHQSKTESALCVKVYELCSWNNELTRTGYWAISTNEKISIILNYKSQRDRQRPSGSLFCYIPTQQEWSTNRKISLLASLCTGICILTGLRSDPRPCCPHHLKRRCTRQWEENTTTGYFCVP